MRVAVQLAATTLLVACGQEIVAPPCSDHDAATALADATADLADAAPPDAVADAAVGADASAAADAAPADGGDPRCPGAYCLTALVASSTRANVREQVTLTPMVSNPGGAPLTFSVRAAEVVAQRRAGRPPLVPADITLELSTDAASGATTFRVADVPPWFIATTFRVRVHAASAGGPDTFAEADVLVRGNTAFSGAYSDVARVYAVASDGRPATARMAGLTKGELITQLARTPSALLLSRDGTLIVHDAGASPPRLVRFELTGHDQQVSTFDFRDGQGAPYLDTDPTYPYSIAELPDGRVAVVDYDFARTTKSRVVVWNADGSYRATLSAADPSAIWTGIGASSAGELLVTRLDGGGRVYRLDPDTGAELGLLADGLPSSARGVLGLPGGAAYVSGDDFIVRVDGRARSLVNMLPGPSGAQWRILVPYDDGRILAAEQSNSDVTSPVIVAGRMFVARLRAATAGNVITNVRGVAYLE